MYSTPVLESYLVGGVSAYEVEPNTERGNTAHGEVRAYVPYH